MIKRGFWRLIVVLIILMVAWVYVFVSYSQENIQLNPENCPALGKEKGDYYAIENTNEGGCDEATREIITAVDPYSMDEPIKNMKVYCIRNNKGNSREQLASCILKGLWESAPVIDAPKQGYYYSYYPLYGGQPSYLVKSSKKDVLGDNGACPVEKNCAGQCCSEGFKCVDGTKCVDNAIDTSKIPKDDSGKYKKCIAGKVNFESEVMLTPNAKGGVDVSSGYESLGAIPNSLRRQIYEGIGIDVDENGNPYYERLKSETLQGELLSKIFTYLTNYALEKVDEQMSDLDEGFENAISNEVNRQIGEIGDVNLRPQLKTLFDDDVFTSEPTIDFNELLQISKTTDKKDKIKGYTLKGVRLAARGIRGPIIFDYGINDRLKVVAKFDKFSELGEVKDYLKDAEVGFVYEVAGDGNALLCVSDSKKIDTSFAVMGGYNQIRTGINIESTKTGKHVDTQISLQIFAETTGESVPESHLSAGATLYTKWRF